MSMPCLLSIAQWRKSINIFNWKIQLINGNYNYRKSCIMNNYIAFIWPCRIRLKFQFLIVENFFLIFISQGCIIYLYVHREWMKYWWTNNQTLQQILRRQCPSRELVNMSTPFPSLSLSLPSLFLSLFPLSLSLILPMFIYVLFTLILITISCINNDIIERSFYNFSH